MPDYGVVVPDSGVVGVCVPLSGVVPDSGVVGVWVPLSGVVPDSGVVGVVGVDVGTSLSVLGVVGLVVDVTFVPTAIIFGVEPYESLDNITFDTTFPLYFTVLYATDLYPAEPAWIVFVFPFAKELSFCSCTFEGILSVTQDESSTSYSFSSLVPYIAIVNFLELVVEATIFIGYSLVFLNLKSKYG